MVVEQSETTIVSSLDVQLYPDSKLGLGDADVYESPNRYSYGGANSHKSHVDQRNRWVIKFKSGMNLFDLIKLRIPREIYVEEGVRWRWSQELFSCALM